MLITASDAKTPTTNELLERLNQKSANFLPTSHFESRYRFHRKIGVGGDGPVNLVKRILDGKPFAAKIIDLSNKRRKYLFKNKADLVLKLRHPHIVQIEDLFVSDERIIFILEYCN